MSTPRIALLLSFLLLAIAPPATAEGPDRTEPVVTPGEQALLRRVLGRADSDRRGAISMLRGQTAAGSSAALDYTLGTLLAKDDRNEEAEKALLTATRKLATFARAWSALGRVRLVLNRPRDAAPALSRAIELGRGGVENWRLLAYAHLSAERYVAAESAYRTALALDPDDESARQGLLRSLLALGRSRSVVPLLADECAREPDRRENPPHSPASSGPG